MGYLFLMTLAGSFLFIGYLGWVKLFGKSMTQCMRYKAMVMVLLVYVIPWVWMKGIYGAILSLFPRPETAVDGKMPVSIADISTKEEAFRTQFYWLFMAVVGIWVVVTAVLLFRKCRKYFRQKRGFLLSRKDCRNGNPRKIAERLRKELHCWRRPEIYETPGANYTFTIGALKPIIFLQSDYADTELELILRHEMMHIARGDLLVKFFMELASCLHWFNPLIYILIDQLELVCETSCDERTVEGCTKEERAAYARLVVKNMRKSEQDFLLGSALENDYETAEERVNLIMRKKKITRWGKVAAAFVFALMLFADSLTAFAYPNIFHVESAGDMNAHMNSGYCVSTRAGVEVSTGMILYDEQLVDKDGNIFPANVASTQGLVCTIFGHNINEGYFEIHNKDKNGGCQVDVHYATWCTICNHVWVGDLYATHIYPVCPH